jgi:hypothetical protein
VEGNSQEKEGRKQEQQSCELPKNNLFSLSVSLSLSLSLSVSPSLSLSLYPSLSPSLSSFFPLNLYM